MIGKEDHKVTSHELLMAVRRKHKSIDTEKKVMCQKNRSQKTIDYVFSFNSETAYSKPWERFANFFFLIWESSHFIKSSSIVMLILFLANSMT